MHLTNHNEFYYFIDTFIYKFASFLFKREFMLSQVLDSHIHNVCYILTDQKFFDSTLGVPKLSTKGWF